MSAPPLALDIDGTLTRPDEFAIDPRVFEPLSSWPAPVVFATGKSFPYPVALCQFLGLPECVVAETGGVVYAGGELRLLTDAAAVDTVATAYDDRYGLGWDGADTVNRWRETEIAVARDRPKEPLVELATEHGLEVVDSGYAYHVKDPRVDKGSGLQVVGEQLGLDPSSFVAVGDSENDVETFDTVGRSFAVENADPAAKAAADEVLDDAHADGTLSVLERLR